MAKTFSVEQMLLCEYATQDINGQFIVAGIIGGGLMFREQPSNWPGYKIFIEIRPFVKSIRASIVFYKKGGPVVMSGNYIYDNQLDEPHSIERNFFNVQIPPEKYQGDGTYVLEIKEGKKVVSSKEFEVLSTPIPMIQLGEVRFEITKPPVQTRSRTHISP